MKQAKIKFTVMEVRDKTLKINLKMSGLRSNQAYYFYQASLKLLSISGNGTIMSQGNYLVIQPFESHLSVSYEIEIGALGKHGRQGCLSSDGVIFYGEQVFLLPLEVITSQDEALHNILSQIKLDFTVLGQHDVTELTHVTWWTIYDLMKSSYCFKDMISLSYKGILLRFDQNFKESSLVFKKVIQFCEYYEGVFGGTLPHLTLNFLTPIEGEEPIFGGASRQSISATFEVENKRDWQLLSHRLFHVFMDHYLPFSTLHLPPHVWLTEGLATYYELAAMEQVFNQPLKAELAKLYEQYQYARIIDETRFRIVPLDESRIKSKGQLEFLHYIQAPLLIFYWQEGRGEHALIHYLLKQPAFDLRKMVESLLSTQSDVFASHYLFSSMPLPLRHGLNSYQSEPSELIKSLTLFEENMASWFALEAGFYEQKGSLWNKSGVKVEEVSELIRLIWNE